MNKNNLMFDSGHSITKNKIVGKGFKQRGMTEIGIAITLFFLLLIVAGAVASYPFLEYRAGKLKFSGQVNMLAQAMKDYSSAGGNYTGASVTTLCDQNLLKGDMCTATFKNAFGGTMTAAPDTDPTKMALTFDVRDAKTAANLKNDYDRIDGWTATVTSTTFKLVR